jgi:hypothetical protein
VRVLVGCEFSGVVRDAFARRGHEAWSCDFLESETPGNHYRGNVLDMLTQPWDIFIAHPTCTFMCNSGVKHLYLGGKKENGPDPLRWANLRESAEFFLTLWKANVPRICLENSIMHRYAKELIGMKQSQTIQPWQFGHGESKGTCFWLKNLRPLVPTNIVAGREQKVHNASPGPNRWKERSRTKLGIGDAMAEQWGAECLI